MLLVTSGHLVSVSSNRALKKINSGQKITKTHVTAYTEGAKKSVHILGKEKTGLKL